MRADIHPEYRPVVFLDATTGKKFLSASTATSNDTTEFRYRCCCCRNSRGCSLSYCCGDGRWRHCD
ncbi:hypothetical protein GQS40_03310|uniref:50S ribosomal protein L31 n=1 Tax=Leuconostoc lactis TaxID=1246 RepID=A0A6L7A8N7_LEULA|nr:hypothetical protein [Leuconostoc lactis]